MNILYIASIIQSGFSLKRIGMRTCIGLLLLLIGLSIPDFGKLVDFLGASTVSLMSFVFPPLFYWKLVLTTNPLTGEPHKFVSIAYTILDINCLNFRFTF